MSLSDLVHLLPPSTSEDPEDIFASAPGLIFTDDLRNSHGSPDSALIYKSSTFGDIELRTADPQGEEERRLFSHYLWNAGVLLAERVGAGDGEWRVKGERVLELGAGVGLDGIVATLAGADEVSIQIAEPLADQPGRTDEAQVVITDYPAPVVLANIRRNLQVNVPAPQRQKTTVEGHEWGDLATPVARQNQHAFTRILAADCYWMPDQHANLVASMCHFLSHDPSARIFAIAGFHTGRARLAAFFHVAAEQGLEAEEMYEEDDTGSRRPWMRERDGGKEDHTERKKWLVVCRLKRKERRV